MKVRKIDFDKAGHLSELCSEYLKGNGSLKKFYGELPEISSFKNQIQKKSSFPQHSREVLNNTLLEQYKDLNVSDLVTANINLLKDSKTFTVTTGHQLNIFSGPLYFIYKIVSTINAAKVLKNEYPEFNFVPVYWMASEDHDFEEISFFRLYGEKYQWKTEQTGPVGTFNPKELIEILNSMPGKNDLFREAYLKHDTLADAVRYYVNELFGESGLVVIDANEASFKKLFSEVIKADIFENTIKPLVEENNKELNSLKYQTQVYARDINFFYLENGFRERIEKKSDIFKVLNTALEFSKGELEELIETNPERFSPNVILRPLFQETILPNLAYFGGPSEVTYWLQLKGIFDYFKVAFPVLLPRNFALIMSVPMARKMEKTHLTDMDLFGDVDELINTFTIENSDKELSLNGKREKILEIFGVIKKQAEDVDETLGPMVEGFRKRSANALDKIEKKMLRAQKKKMSDKSRQITEVFNYIRPGGTPQERKDNFLNFYHTNPNFINDLLEIFDPFDFSYLIIRNE